MAFTEGNKMRFIQVETKPEFPEPLGQDPHKAVRIVLSLENRHGVIGIPNQCAIATAVLAHHRDQPLIQDMVEKCVRNHRRDNGALWATQFIVDNPTRSLDAGFEHPRNQP